MSGEEIRAASHSTVYVSQSSTDSWKLKLPFLCARPGNIGVQIDSYRTMAVFNRPRCTKFTGHFLGILYENSSMENYSRVLERTSKRTRIVEERLAKLKAREQEIIDDDERRRQLRHERELKRQRKLWLHHQSRKKQEQRQREEMAATIIQCYVRGYFARQERNTRREIRVQDHAAQTLQRSSRSFLMRKQRKQRALEQQKERQMQAATILQRQTRKRLAIAARQRLQKLEVSEPHHCPSLDAVQEDDTVDISRSPVKSTQLDELDRHISLDLLFSNDDEGESPAMSSPYGNGLKVLISPSSHSDWDNNTAEPASPKAVYQPKRPVSIKRVGGGFRATSYSPSKLVVPTRVFSQKPQPQPHRRMIQGAHSVDVNRPTPNPLTQLGRRPSVPSSSSHASADESTCKRFVPAPEHSLLPFDDEAILSQAPPPRPRAAICSGDYNSSNSAIVAIDDDDDEHALEELMEAYSHSHVT